ncbi:PIN2/TERF1-interacting telomerase inhibitor 1-like isoform X1 [Biomphalaria pfeifferi]|uniref:PIN2/TERF1-interacting telomerase inhibitor 1-like isoform X1 n=1 Tax=Biomphalaria pfeifferi TaxID=112525 RepID=A0AAD8F3V7_BIOPF|nr:PIN2/TERF1-interacting telomerase inhibitor 1-like isoform X1 [Biomphalaria pfeifferi]
MALLAEQKRKTKFGLDPRNTNWSNDDSKIGQKLMEKMGWAKGKGLGAKEDGMRDHIKATYKSDTRGLGCTPKDADAWIAHQDDFNNLLQQLNSQTSSQQSSDKVVEERPPDGHKRYYGRFARGRVPTLRSTEDLNCIFGKRKNVSEPATPTRQSDSSSSGDESDEKKHGITTIKSSSSVQEYFAQKMAALKAKKDKTESVTEQVVNMKSSDEQRVPAVYGAVQFTYEQDTGSKEFDSSDENVPNINFSHSQNKEETSNLDIDEKLLKKKRKKKDKKHGEENLLISDQLVSSGVSVDEEKATAKEKDSYCESQSKKKKKHQLCETGCLGQKDAKQSNSLLVETSKRKLEDGDDSTLLNQCKRKKLDKEELNSKIDVKNEHFTNSKKKRSKSKLKDIQVETIDCQKKELDPTHENIEDSKSEAEQCKKKKKKNEEQKTVGQEDSEKKNVHDLSKDDTLQEPYDESKTKQSKKKKKKNKELKTKEDSSSVNDLSEESKPLPETQERKKKKTKNKKQKKKSEINNMFPGSNIGDIQGYAV